jgi:hypothetical protein
MVPGHQGAPYQLTHTLTRVAESSPTSRKIYQRGNHLRGRPGSRPPPASYPLSSCPDLPTGGRAPVSPPPARPCVPDRRHAPVYPTAGAPLCPQPPARPCVPTAGAPLRPHRRRAPAPPPPRPGRRLAVGGLLCRQATSACSF